MKKILKHLLTLVMTAIFISAASVSVSAAENFYSKSANKGTKSSNISTNGYTSYYNGWMFTDSDWSSVVKSNLFVYNGCLYRVENIGSSLLLEKYSSDFRYVGKASLKMELPLFGGFYSGEKYNYIVFGKENTSESKTAEVLRVVKYTKGMKRVSSVSMYGCNTRTPFDAGSLRMDEADGTLFIHTCKKMFTSADGLNHQANMSYYVRTSDMKILRSEYEVTWGIAYASHSFNQFVRYKDGYLYSVSHGDAYNRAITVYRTKNYSSSKPTVDEQDVFKIKGNTGDNYTGVCVGGAEISSDSLLIAGCSVPQDSSWGTAKQKNIFLITMPLSDSSDYRIKYFTSLKESDKTDISEPKLVKITDKSFMLLWTQTKNNKTKLYITMLDGKGEKTGKTYVYNNAYLSDCQPIIYNGQAVWYTTNQSKPTFMFFNADGNFDKQKSDYNKNHKK